MVVGLLKRMGVPVVMTLAILGAETSLGDPILGGPLATDAFNYGCLKYMGTSNLWGALSNGKMHLRSADWYTFPSPVVGMEAWGLYIAYGPSWNPGLYLKSYPHWDAIAAVYYGRAVEDFTVYLATLEKLALKFSTALKKAGYDV